MRKFSFYWPPGFTFSLLTREKWIGRQIDSIAGYSGTEAGLREVKEKRICERSRGICKPTSQRFPRFLISSFHPLSFSSCVLISSYQPSSLTLRESFRFVNFFLSQCSSMYSNIFYDTSLFVCASRDVSLYDIVIFSSHGYFYKIAWYLKRTYLVKLTFSFPKHFFSKQQIISIIIVDYNKEIIYIYIYIIGIYRDHRVTHMLLLLLNEIISWYHDTEYPKFNFVIAKKQLWRHAFE